MKIKVIKCTEPKGWYQKHIGEIFEVLEISKLHTGEEVYITHKGRIVNSFVAKVDCEIIEE